MELFQQAITIHLQFDWYSVFLPVPLLAGMIIETFLWKQFFLRRHSISFLSLFGAHAGSEAVLLSIPGGFALADPLKILWLQKRHHLSTSNVLAGLVARHWLLGITQGLYVLAVCSIGWITFQSSAVSSCFQHSSLLLGVVVLAGIAAMLFSTLRMLFRGELAKAMWRWLNSLPLPPLRIWLKKHHEMFVETDVQFRTIGDRSVLSLAVMICLYGIFWMMEGFETLLVAHILGFPLNPVQALLIEGLLSLVKLGVFFLPGGVGAKEAGYIALCASFGIAAGRGMLTGLMVIKRLISLIFIILGYGCICVQGIFPVLKRFPVWKVPAGHELITIYEK